MRRDFKGVRAAIAGLGVSGIASAKAITELGGKAVALDQKPADNLRQIRQVEELQSAGIEVVTGWHGRIDPKDFDLLVVSPGFPRNHPATQDMAGKPIWGEIELAYQISRAPIYAITGTNGKSTTVVLLWSLMQAAGLKTRLCGNIAGSGYPEMTLTEAALLAEEDEHLAAEISSFQLENAIDFRPKAAAISNITPDHLDRHPSFEDYRDTKLRLFEKMDAGDTVVLNASEPSLPLDLIQKHIHGRPNLSVFDPTGQTTGTHTGRQGNTLTFSGHEAAVSQLPVPGEHFITNSMMAWEMASTATELGEESLSQLLAFKGLANRMEYLGEKRGIMVVNNSMCTNPAAVIASSLSVRRKQHLLIGGLTKGLDFSPLREYLEGSDYRVYLFGPNPEKMDAVLGGGWPIFDSMPAAFKAAVGEAKEGEAVLLAPGCASADPYASFRERGEAFRQIAKEWLEQ